MDNTIREEKPVTKRTRRPKNEVTPEVVVENTAPLNPCAGRVNAARLNVRSAPITGNNVVFELKLGEKVQIDPAFEDDTFYKVKLATLDGYCMKQFITVE